jgi:putative membrane protein
MVMIFKLVYTLVTPHNEIQLVRNGNMAAASQFAGAIIGFSLPLASAISHSVSMVDFVTWGVVALVVQILVFFVFSKIITNASMHISNNNVAVGVLMGAISIAFGVINAACMTY